MGQRTDRIFGAKPVSGRENENNNVLKTKGYHIEHNFGHGKRYLAAFLLSLNLLAFLFHTVLQWCDEKYALLCQVLEAIRKVNIALTYSSLGYYPIFTEVFLMAVPTRKPYLTDLTDEQWAVLQPLMP